MYRRNFVTAFFLGASPGALTVTKEGYQEVNSQPEFDMKNTIHASASRRMKGIMPWVLGQIRGILLSWLSNFLCQMLETHQMKQIVK